jgi:hypothetical protein
MDLKNDMNYGYYPRVSFKFPGCEDIFREPA